MTSSRSEQKKLLRNEIAAQLKKLSDNDKSKAAQDASKKLREHFLYQRSQTVAVYLAFPNEVSLDAFIQSTWDSEKVVAAPRVEGNKLVPCKIENLAKDVVQGSWNVREPRAFCVPIPEKKIDLVLVPGLAFDRMGWRLGRGQGFYDRFLSALPDTVHTIGICFKCQLVASVPYGANDICVNEVIAV